MSKMTLQKYYKLKVYEYGYEMGKQDYQFERDTHRWATKDIYFNDEMDYYICADYFGIYVGADENWTQEDIDFLEVLGFGTGDFIENEMIEGDENYIVGEAEKEKVCPLTKEELYEKQFGGKE